MSGEINTEQRETLARMARAIHGRFGPDAPRCPTLAVMAGLINALLPQYEAQVVRSQSTKERRTPAARYVFSRRTYVGNMLQVSSRTSGEPVYTHNSAETYRHNTEVAEWIFRQLSLDYQDFLDG